MELRVLQYFVEVANEGNITRAAEHLHLTQPTLTRQLHALEDEIGKPLLNRHPHHVTLTEHGLFLYRRAQEILALSNSTLEELQADDEKYAGTILIAAADSLAVHDIGRVMAEVIRTYPEVRYELYSMDGIDAMRYVDRKLVDFALVAGNIDTEKYHHVTLPHQDVWGLLLRRDHPLAQKPHLTPEDIRNEPILWSRQSGSYSDLDGWLGFPNERLNVIGKHNLISNAAIMVEEGLGSSICFESLINTEGTPLCFRRFEPEMRASTSLIWRRDAVLSRQTQLFLNSLEIALLLSDA